MKRKDFLTKGMLSGTMLTTSFFGSTQTQAQQTTGKASPPKDDEEVVVERAQQGEPHKGKVLLAVQAHSDDIPLFAGGLIAKLMHEGYKGYLVRTSDDDKGDAEGNRKDTDNIAKFYGMEKAFHLMYSHHQMDNMGIQDLKGRLIFLIRLLKVDTIVTWDPSQHYEENPDHAVTARAVEAARWMAGTTDDYPEHVDAGLKPHTPAVRYYFSRNPLRVNRVVDISDFIDNKVEANMLNTTKGPAGQGLGKKLRDELAAQGKKLDILGSDDRTANFNWVKHFVFDIDSKRLNFGQESNRKIGEKYGLAWAEQYYYMSDLDNETPNNVDRYVEKNAKRI